MNGVSVLILNKNKITNYSTERNRMLKSARDKWVLFLDSDESLSKELKKEIESGDYQKGNFDAFYIDRKNYFLGQYVGTDRIIRLAKRDSGKWSRAVHETWNISSERIGYLSGFIIHNTAESLSYYLNKINNYSNLHSKANKDEGKKSSLFKIIIYPIGKFIVTLLKSRNLVFSIMQSLHSFLSWTKLYFLQY